MDEIERAVEFEELHSMRWLGNCCRFLEVVKESVDGLGSFELHKD